jgi:RHS repeat-associated protein
MSKFKLSLKTIIILIGIVFATNLFANLPACDNGCKKTCCPSGSGGGGPGSSSGPGNGPPGPGPMGPGPMGPGPMGPGPMGPGPGGPGGSWGKGAMAGGGSASNGSIDISINFGKAANESANLDAVFSIFLDKPSATVFSPANLQYKNMLLSRINKDETADLPSDVARKVGIFTEDREMLTFEFAQSSDGSGGTVVSGLSKVSGEKATLNYKLRMVDASGNENTSDPTYYDLYKGNGSFVRYSRATGKAVSYHLAAGRILTPDAPSVGLEGIYNEDGVVRQIWSKADGLADIVVTENGISYEIRIYAHSTIGAKVDGVYTTTGSPHTVWRIENPNPGQSDKVKVTKTVNAQAQEYNYEYSYAVEEWLLKSPGNLIVSSKSSSWNYSRDVRTVIAVKKTASGQVASKTSQVIQKYAFGERTVVSTNDPDGANLRTVSTYYTNPVDEGSYGRPSTISYPDGSWVKNYYDSEGRSSQVVTPFKNSAFNSSPSAASNTAYSYAPLKTEDVLPPDDERPRTTTIQKLGITVSKTFNAYYFENGQYNEVAERASTPSAAFGDSANLKTTRIYYVPGACTSPTAGRLYREYFPNDTVKTYNYENGTYTVNADPAQSTFTAGTGSAVKMSVVYGTVASPDGVANKSIKQVTVFDEFGNTVRIENHIYTGNSTYTLVSWNAYIYDELCRVTDAYASNGTHRSQTWNCCSLESKTEADGTQYSYGYDILKRRISTTKLGAGSQPNIVTSYTYDASGRTLSTTSAAGGLSLGTSTEYNAAGQITKRTNQHGLDSTYTYLNAVNTGTVKGSVVTKTLPGGFTVSSEDYLDGSPREITGDAVVAKYYDYGVNNDGSTWTETRIGRNDSARFAKTAVDMLGRVVKQERSGYGGTIVVQAFYNIKGQLIKTSTTNKADTLYVYDELGNKVKTGLDINSNGTLDLASMDRINETEIAFANESSAWWSVKTNKVYATDNSDTATTVSTQKSRLNGFTGSLVAEIKQIDIQGNETIQTTAVDSANKTITRTVNTSGSNVDTQTITVNGLLTSKRTASDLTYNYAYDALERLIGLTDPRTGQSTTAYYTSGAGKIGQVYTQTDAANNTTTYDYDSTTGRLAWVQNALSKKTYYVYNALGKAVKTWGDSGYPIEMVYDNFGQGTQLKTYRAGTGWTAATWPTSPGTADITSWAYDEASGKITSKTFADSNSVAYSYRTDSKLSTRTWARTSGGNPLVTTFSYSTNTKQLVGIDYSDSTQDITFTYNRLGQQKQITDSVGTRTFAYNSALQPATETIIGGLYSKTISRDYATTGMLGRYTGLHIGTEYDVDYGYDTYGRFATVTNGSDVYTYSYLANSNLVSSITYPNTITVNNVYEANRNLVDYVENKYGATVISKYDYTNDAIGRRTAMAKSGTAFSASDTITYGYNDRSELTSADATTDANYNFTFAFDNIGNRSSYTTYETGSSATSAYTLNNLNQYTAITNPTQAPTYDADGDMLSDGTWSFTWNAENRLIVAEKSDAKLEFKYDYMGRRVEKKVYSGSTENWTLDKHLKFVYNGYEQIEELDSVNSDAILKKRIWGNGKIICDIHGATTYYALGDANKNITEYLDNSGIIQAHYEYSPFGKITKKTGTKQDDFDYRFSSEVLDYETGLVYYNYRYYSPTLGKWLSRDPIGEFEQVSEDEYIFNSLYSFVNNNSTNNVDFLGHGLVQWILTGDWNAPQNVADAAARGWADGLGGYPYTTLAYTGKTNPTDAEWKGAMDGAGAQQACWQRCMKHLHKTGWAKANAGIGSIAAVLGGLGARIPKFRIVNSQSPYTSISRVIGRLIGMGAVVNGRSLTERIGRAIGRSKFIAAAKIAAVAAALAEAGMSTHCAKECKKNPCAYK